MGSVACWAFVGVSAAAVVLVPFFPLMPNNLALPGFLLSIPAVPYFMPYWIGVNLVRRAGEMDARELARAA